MAFAPDHISRRLKQRSLIAVALVVALTAAAALLATTDPEPGPAPATASPSILAPQSAVAASRDPDVAGRRSTLAAVTSWRDMRLASSPAAIAATGDDLVAVDPNLIDALPASEQAAALETLRRKPDGASRLLIGHLSVGNFEPDRPYWRPKSAAKAAMKLDGEAPTSTDAQSTSGARAVAVCYWESEWQAQLYGRPEALLDRLIASGYDGVYLADAEAYRLARSELADADTRMADLIRRMSAHARRLNPQFVVMLGGAEELLSHTVVHEAVDAIAKTNLLFGINGPGMANDEADIASSLHALKSAVRAGQPVFVSERITTTEATVAARRRLADLGFIADINRATMPLRGTGWSKVKF